MMKKEATMLVANRISHTQMKKHFAHYTTAQQQQLYCTYSLMSADAGVKSHEIWLGKGDAALPVGKVLVKTNNGWVVKKSPIYPIYG